MGETLNNMIKHLTAKYVAKTPNSRALFERAKKVLPGGVVYSVRYFKPYPIYVTKGKGALIWDVDGNAYDDYWMGHGAHVLGHAPDIVIERIAEISKRGTHLGFENPYAVEYAELLTKVLPGVEMIRFTNSGTEANMLAVRIARAYTKRRYIVKMEGGWHGALDQLLVAVRPPFNGPQSAGLLDDMVKYTIAVPFNDLNALERVLNKHDVAAILIEPVPGAGGFIEPLPGYLKGVRDLADKYGVPLIFDEVVTGFRLNLGGAQQYFDVRADLAVYGKIVGGGYPGAGAVGGREEIMSLLDHIKYPDPKDRVVHGGTFIGNPITIVAGHALIEYLHKNRGLYDEFNSTWTEVARSLDKLCEEFGRLCWVTNVGSLIGLHFTYRKPINVKEAYELRLDERLYEALHLFMRVEGVLYMSTEMPHLMPSMVHSKEEARKLVKLFAQFLEGLLN